MVSCSTVSVRLKCVLAVSLLFGSGCSDDHAEDFSRSEAAASRPSIRCLVPIDIDGDGIGDVFRSNSIRPVAGIDECRVQLQGAVIDESLHPDKRSGGLSTKAIALY